MSPKRRKQLKVADAKYADFTGFGYKVLPAYR